MNKTGNPTAPTGVDHACLADALLQQLIGEALSAEEQGALISHLDGCEHCCQRLDALAGRNEVWAAVRRSLSQTLPAPTPELARVTSAMQSSDWPTNVERSAIAHASQFSFLEPCGLPDRIGRLGSYEIIELLGHGGMGYVFKAFDPSLAREVALKVLATPLVQGARARSRFHREARAVAAIRSEHVVAIFAVEESQPIPYLVMEYVHGPSLHHRLKCEPQPGWEEITRIGAEIADGLRDAHAVGLIHRDIKPPNILLEGPQGRVKITDFGLAKTLGDASLTQTGTITGTPEFMAPEQVKGEQVDHRADLFSLGSVLYTMCAGHPPFGAATTHAVLHRTCESSPVPIRSIRKDVPPELGDIITRLLEKDPADRYDNAAEVAEVLRAVDLHSGAQVETQPVATSSRTARLGPASWVTLAAALSLALMFLMSEVFGLSRIVATALGSSGSNAGGSDIAAALTDGGGEAVVAGPALPVDQEQASPVEQPMRIQIVTPDGLMREAIRAKKDQLPETTSPHLVRKLEGHTGPVQDVDISPDGKFILSCSGWPGGDRTIRLWEVETGKEIRQFDMSEIPLAPERSGGREAPGEVYCVAFAPNGNQAVAGIAGGAIGLWDVATGQLVRRFEGHTATVYGIDVSPSGDRVVSGGRDSTARLWDLESGKELLRIPHKNWVRSVAFSPDGKTASTGCLDHTIRLWDLESATRIAEVELKDTIWSVAFSPDGGRIACVSGSAVTVWDAAMSEPIVEVVHPVSATCVAFSPDGTRLLTCGYDTNVRLWDAKTGEPLEIYRGHRGWVWNIVFTPDGQFAVSSGGGRNTANQGTNPGIDFALRLWKMPEKEVRVVQAQ